MQLGILLLTTCQNVACDTKRLSRSLNHISIPRRNSISQYDLELLPDPERPQIWFLSIVPFPEWRPRTLLVGPRRCAVSVPLRIPFIDSDGSEYMMLDSKPETWARLWPFLGPLFDGGPIAVLVLGDAEEEQLEGSLDPSKLEELLLASEREAGVEIKTNVVTPPLYVEAFWGPRPRGRLDAMIGRLDNFNIMPEALLARARDRKTEANWAVLAPANLPDRAAVLEALQPLIALRGGMVMTLEDGHDARTIDEVCAGLANMPQEARPYYLLLLGDFPDVSMEAQYMLQSFAGLGRLCFQRPEDYRAYAEKVVASEEREEAGDLLYIATDSDDVNQLNYQELVEPLARHPDLVEAGKVLARGRASKARSLSLLRAAPIGSIAFLTAHGHEYLSPLQRDPDTVFAEQRHWQGAPVMDDFEGDVAEGLLGAGDAAAGSFLPGGVLILDCCYSAGTVQQDTQPEWLFHPMPARLRPPEEFLSAFATAALANPDGPLAIFGHVNRSHQYAYFDPSKTWPSMTFGVYLEMLHALLSGESIALGRETCRRMTVAYMAQCQVISYQIEQKLTGQNRGHMGFTALSRPLSDYARSFVQYSFGTWNFRNYAILGDPMVRVPKRRDAA